MTITAARLTKLRCSESSSSSSGPLTPKSRDQARRSLEAAERRQRLGDDALRVEACGGVHAVGLVVILELIGQGHGANLEALVERARFAEQRQHVRAEAAGRALLDGDHQLVLRRKAQDQLTVERLGETGVG